MMKFNFSIDEDHNVILVDAKLNGFSTRLLLDTGQVPRILLWT